MEILVVTGLSGAGKSRVVDALEDIGFYCVDNLPPELLPKFAELCQQTGDLSRVALVVDARSGDPFLRLLSELDALKRSGGNPKLLFLDCEDEVLQHRYKETRRQHPLFERAGGSTAAAIALERHLLSAVRERADYRVDTTHLSVAQLKERISRLFLHNVNDSMLVECMSFGFKYGVPSEADLMFDVRCFPNPFYLPELKHKTGMDDEVRNYVMQWDEVKAFSAKLKDLAAFLLPLYCKEGKSQVIIAIGCTGGKHRSVTLARELSEYIRSLGYPVRDTHRDITR